MDTISTPVEPNMLKPIVVGYDGSDGSKRAVRWAARHASATGLPLIVAYCWAWPLFTHDLGPVTGVKDSGLQNEAEKTASEGLDLAVQTAPDADVSKRLVAGFPAEVLTRLSTEASLLVTGTRGLGGFSGLLVGSVSLHLAASASCPILVVREDQPEDDNVLVAVDGSPESDRAVLKAADLAKTLHQSLHVLHAQPFHRHMVVDLTDAERHPIIEQSLNLLPTGTDLAVVEETVSAISVPGAIVDRARTASCVVLGAKGRNTLGARRGSTVHAVLHHATGNVLVVR
ncbi:universal stress protein [Arthrobacter cheniae]|uniref:Universal stress protein n=1 Tax=Arthrobacter cheniae TaxID=1258888 RepID=A0A3A5LYW7_9MICC|nr:universal stress protein [Arthrobacter cheniae]RJT75113.1 universal stress protein [Arthrobacter cheniae]